MKVLDFVNQLEQQEATGREAQKIQVAAQSEQINDQINMTDQASQLQGNEQQNEDQQDIMSQMAQGG